MTSALNGAVAPMRRAGASAAEELLRVEDLKVHFPLRKGVLIQRQVGSIKAVDGVSFALARGDTLGLVGESGCGKSTTSTMIMRLIDKSDGSLMFDGEDIGAIPAKKFAGLPMRRRIQMVFQDPTDSLNPRFTAARAIADPILRMSDIQGAAAVSARCEELARQVGLPVELLDRFPHQLSGGQKARVGIARALAVRPAILLMDEPLSALDSQTRELLMEDFVNLLADGTMGAVYVTHNLEEAVRIADRIVVLSRRPGKVRETVTIPMTRAERGAIEARGKLLALQNDLWSLIREQAIDAEREVQHA